MTSGCHSPMVGFSGHISSVEEVPVRILVVIVFLLFSVTAFASDDVANRAKFEKECAVMIAPGGPCADVVKGGGGRRGERLACN